MKKIIIVCLTVLMVLSLCGCSKTEEEPKDDGTKQITVTLKDMTMVLPVGFVEMKEGSFFYEDIGQTVNIYCGERVFDTIEEEVADIYPEGETTYTEVCGYETAVTQWSKMNDLGIAMHYRAYAIFKDNDIYEITFVYPLEECVDTEVIGNLTFS